jgi:hypothetical protein
MMTDTTVNTNTTLDFPPKTDIPHESFQNTIPEIYHYNTRCNGCGQNPIKGHRYKSIDRLNFDLCQTCIDRTPNGSETYLRITDYESNKMVPWFVNREHWIHQGISCFHCQRNNLRGWRYLCVQCGINICEFCERYGKHDISHPLLKMTPINPPISVLPGVTFGSPTPPIQKPLLPPTNNNTNQTSVFSQNQQPSIHNSTQQSSNLFSQSFQGFGSNQPNINTPNGWPNNNNTQSSGLKFGSNFK